MRNLLITFSSLLMLASAWPYIIDIIKKNTKPRVVTWFTWFLLMAVACAASFSDKQYASGFLLLFAALQTLIIVVLGLIHGDRTFEKFDIYCQVGAIVGLVLWLVFNSPSVAIISTITIDLIGVLPTIKHVWQKPYEETLLTYVMVSISGLLALLAATSFQITAAAYPIYFILLNALISVIILYRKRSALATETADNS